MSYYPTIDEDITRAKEILAKGKGCLGIGTDIPAESRCPHA